MRRNCNLELRLFPQSVSFLSANIPGNSIGDHPSIIRDHQHVAIFHSGRVCVCDVAELQAKAILWLANRETQERTNTPPSEPKSRSVQSQMYSPPGLSMVRSLQRFLRKRKNRIQATSPYNRKYE